MLAAGILIAMITLSVACSRQGAPARAATISTADAQATLKDLALTAEDIGHGFTQDVARVQTNDDEASARADTAAARQQYAEWGQVLAYNVQFAAPQDAALTYTGAPARIMHTTTLYDTADGAGAALAFTRTLSPSVLANVLVNDAAGTRISDTQVVKDIEFPAKGDESFAWRATGKATFPNGRVATVVADAVFVREGNVTATVTAVALGERPDRAQLVALVDRFVARAQAAAR